jgi:hypothetical protein
MTRNGGSMRVATIAVLITGCLAARLGAQPLPGRTLNTVGMPAKTDNLSAVVVMGDRVVLADDEQRSLLIGRLKADGTLAIEASPPLSGPGKDEFDLEGLAVVGDAVYAVGSHSAARRSADSPKRPQAENLGRLQEKIREAPERKVLFRVKLGPSGSLLEEPAGTLADIIKADAVRGDKTEGLLARGLGVPGKENGIDIEGLAADGNRLWVGFRGPVLRHGYVPVLRVNASSFPVVVREDLLLVRLGGRGIREIVRVSDGFIVLAGPVGDSDQSTQLVFWDGLSCLPGTGAPACKLSVLGEIGTVTGVDGDGQPAVGRAEGLAVLEDSSTKVRVLVVFDGVQGGAPTEFSVQR